MDDKRKQADSTAAAKAPTAAAVAATSSPHFPGDDALPIEPATGPADEDEFGLTDSYEVRSTGSTSVTSSVYAHSFERGRRYQIFKNGRYPIPNDDLEQDREDMKHAMLLEVTDGRLFYAPIGDNPQMILDIGTGTGIWAIDVGDRYPSARVRGIDLSPIQPVWVPPNVDFLVDDCEKEWLDRDCDLIHLRFMTAILKDTANLMNNAFRSLKPGGWVESQELYAYPLCDDGTMPDDDPVKKLYDLVGLAFEKFGMDCALATKMEPYYRSAGFVNIQCVVKKVPIGVWALDKTQRLIGLYQKTVMEEFLPVLGGRVFKAIGLSEVEAQVTLATARKGLNDTSVHRYFTYYFWSAQKPLDASG